jgi:hypothetical protein
MRIRGVSMSTQPKWLTPTRKSHLVKLFLDTGNRCLLGHETCPIPEHYLYARYKAISYAEAKTITCVDSNGITVKGSDGKPLTITVYANRKACLQIIEQARLYDIRSENVIQGWQQSDREQASLEWQAERKALHSLGETRTPILGRWNNISRDIFHSSQPLFYIEKLGMDCLRLQPFAKVKIGSSFMRLYVDLADSLRPISKNQRHKAIRYGKRLPATIEERINERVKVAVQHYLNN